MRNFPAEKIDEFENKTKPHKNRARKQSRKCRDLTGTARFVYNNLEVILLEGVAI